MAQILTYFGVGGFALVFLSVFFEITKIPLNPISWLGKKLNKASLEELEKTNKKIDELDEKISNVEGKLDEHIAQSLRTKIISFQDDIINLNMIKTRKQWKEVLRACAEYEKYIKDNGLINGDATEGIEFIRAEFQRCCEARNFKDLPVPSEAEKNDDNNEQ